jgi:ABC-type phosphate transport system substrate-binding protein
MCHDTSARLPTGSLFRLLRAAFLEVFVLKKTSFAGLILLAVALLAPANASQESFKVIVNPSVVGAKVPRATLAQIYLGKARSWGDGSAITPVDQSSVSPVRRAFSDTVLETPVDAVKQHWMRNVSAGHRPPAVKESDAAVIAFVASSRGAVGYVSESAEIPATVRVVAVD